MIYTTPTCPYCRMAKEFLLGQGVEFEERDVVSDRAAAEEVYRLTGQMGVPVIVADGQVVVGFDRPRLERLLQEVRVSGRERLSLGLRVADASKIREKQGLPPLFGAYIGYVHPASVAERAGLTPGDVIIEVNLQPINGVAALEQALSHLAPNSRLSITFVRAGQKLQSEMIV